MKIEIGAQKPAHFTDSWPGEYSYFSHYEHASVVPQVLSVITTLKQNGATNACFHSGALFSGDSSGYFAILSGIRPMSHTYHNIMREKEFCVNFLSGKYYDACEKTIEQNGDENDELAAGGFTREQSKAIAAPRIAEAFLSFECKLVSKQDLTGREQIYLIIGQVQNVSVEQEYHKSAVICGPDGFMYNIPSPANPLTGEREPTAMAGLRLEREF